MSLSEKYYLQGKKYIQNQRYDKAEESFKKLIELNPIFVDAYNQLGNVYYEQQEYQEAEIWYKKAIKINPKIPDFYNNLGNVYSDSKQYDKAVIQYQKSSKLSPNDADIHNNLANAYYNISLHQKAIEQFNIAIRLNPHDPDYRTNLNCIYSDLIKNHNSGRFDQNWVFDQNKSNCHRILGDYYKENNLKQKAIEQYERTLELQPQCQIASIDLMYLYEENHEHKKLIQLFEQMQSKSKRSFEKTYKKAIKSIKLQQFQKTLLNSPDDANKYVEFGNSFIGEGDISQGIKYLQKAENLYQTQEIIEQIQQFYGKKDEDNSLKASQITQSESQIIQFSKVKEYLACLLNLLDCCLKQQQLCSFIIDEYIQKLSVICNQNEANQQKTVQLFQKMGLTQIFVKRLQFFRQAHQLIKKNKQQSQNTFKMIRTEVQKSFMYVYRLLKCYHILQAFNGQTLTIQNKPVEKNQNNVQEDKNDLMKEHELIISQIKTQIDNSFLDLKMIIVQRQQRLKHNQSQEYGNVQPRKTVDNYSHDNRQRQILYQLSPSPTPLYRKQEKQMRQYNENIDSNSYQPNRREVSLMARRVHNNASKSKQSQLKLKKKQKSKQTKFSHNEIQQIYDKFFKKQYNKDKKEMESELFQLKNKMEQYQNCFDKNQMLTNRLNELQKQNKKKISNYGKKLYSFLVSIIQAYRMLDTNMLQKGEGLNEATGMVSKLLNYAQMLPVIGQLTTITKQITGLYWQKQDEIRSKTIVVNLSYFWNQKLMSNAISEIVHLIINQQKYCDQIEQFQEAQSSDLFEIFQSKKEDVVKIFTSVQKKQEEEQQTLAIVDSSFILLGLAEISEEQIEQYKKNNPQNQNILMIQAEKLIKFRNSQKQKQEKVSASSQPNKPNKINEPKKPLKNIKYSIVFILLALISLLITFVPFEWSRQYDGNFNKIYDCFNKCPQHKIAFDTLQKNQYSVVYGSVQNGLLNFIEHFSNEQLSRQKNVFIQNFYTKQNGMIEFKEDFVYEKDTQSSLNYSESITTWILQSQTVSKLPKQAILNIIAKNPEDKVIVVLPSDKKNEKISKVIKLPKFTNIQYDLVDDSYIKQSIQTNFNFDEQKTDVLYQYYGNPKTIFDAFKCQQQCTIQSLVGEDYRQLIQFSQQDKRLLKNLCKKGKTTSESLSKDLQQFGLMGKDGQVYWKSKSAMLNYMVHKNIVCDKRGVNYQHQNQHSQNEFPQNTKTIKMKIKRSGGKQHIEIQRQEQNNAE